MIDEKTKLAIILGIIVPSAAVLVILVTVYIVRKVMEWYRYGGSGYNQVNHELDEEEIEFKRILEVKHGRTDIEYETLFNGKESDDQDENVFESDDFSFNAKERDRLSMLEKFRTNLVAEASSSSSIHDKIDDDDLESANDRDSKLKLNIRIKDKANVGGGDGEVKEITKESENVGTSVSNGGTNQDDTLFNAKELRALQSFYDSGSDTEMQL